MRAVAVEPATGHLVVYKAQPARVEAVDGDKVTLTLAAGNAKKVRPKDVTVLHPGPVADLRNLDAGSGDLEEAWEVFAGESLTLPDLAELAFGEFTPAAAWSAARMPCIALIPAPILTLVSYKFIQVVRPPLHQFMTALQVLRTVIRGLYLISFFVSELTLNQLRVPSELI